MENAIDNAIASPFFETERLVAGTWNVNLAEPAMMIYGDENVTRWLWGAPEESVNTLRQRIEELIQRNQKWPDHFGSWPTFRKSDRALIGANLMKPLPDADGNFTEEIEIGWHLASKYWGNGYATEGANKMIAIAFEQLQIPTLWAVTKVDNVASQKVAQRIGMRHVGQTEKYYGQTLELFRLDNQR